MGNHSETLDLIAFITFRIYWVLKPIDTFLILVSKLFLQGGNFNTAFSVNRNRVNNLDENPQFKKPKKRESWQARGPCSGINFGAGHMSFEEKHKPATEVNQA